VPDDKILDALLRNTEALTTINANMSAFQQEYAQGKSAAKEHDRSTLAKLDNLDRSVGELRQVVEQREGELTRIYNLLNEERADRKDVTKNQGKDERELIRELIRTELGERRDERNLAVRAVQAVWTTGGKYIMAALAILFVAWVMKLTGVTLSDILGLAR
jgi:hypothetical protein